MNSLRATHVRSLAILNKISSQLEIPGSITKIVKRYYFKFANKEKFTNHVLLTALCLLMTINENKIPITYSKIVTTYQENGHRVTNGNLTKLRLELGLKLKTKKASSFIPIFVNQLTNSPEIQKLMSKKINGKFHYPTLLENISIKYSDLVEKNVKEGIHPRNKAIISIYLTSRAIGSQLKISPFITHELVGKYTECKSFTVRDLMYRKFGKFYDETKPFLENKINQELTN